MKKTLSQIAIRRKQIIERLLGEAKAVAREPKDITLIAVSKRQSLARVEEMWQAGQRIYGENQVYEAELRWQSKRESGEDFQLHLIGHLQSNKAERAVALFDVIETLDSIKLAKKLNTAMYKTGRNPEILVQVNTGEEPQKAGVLPSDLADFLKQVAQDTDIIVSGLMCLPPQKDEPGLHFALLAKLAKQHKLNSLSMGMSADFETAVRFGATSVRIGSAVFGDREN